VVTHPSAADRAQDRESSPARDRRSTIVPRNQPRVQVYTILCAPTWVSPKQHLDRFSHF